MKRGIVMKRIIAGICAVTMLFALAGCSESKADKPSESSLPDSSLARGSKEEVLVTPDDTSSQADTQEDVITYLKEFDGKGKTYTEIRDELLSKCGVQAIALSKNNVQAYGAEPLYLSGIQKRADTFEEGKNNEGKTTYVTKLLLDEEGTYYVIFGAGNITREKAENYIPKDKTVYFYGLIVKGTETQIIPSFLPLIVGTEEDGYQIIEENVSQLNTYNN